MDASDRFEVKLQSRTLTHTDPDSVDASSELESDSESDVPRRVARRRARDERRLLQSIKRRTDGTTPIDQCTTDAVRAGVIKNWKAARTAEEEVKGSKSQIRQTPRVGSGVARASAAIQFAQRATQRPPSPPPQRQFMKSTHSSTHAAAADSDTKSTILKPGTVLFRTAMAGVIAGTGRDTLLASEHDSTLSHRATALLTHGASVTDSNRSSIVYDIASEDRTAVPALELQIRSETRHLPSWNRHTITKVEVNPTTHSLAAVANHKSYAGGYTMDRMELPHIRPRRRKGRLHAHRTVYHSGEVQHAYIFSNWIRPPLASAAAGVASQSRSALADEHLPVTLEGVTAEFKSPPRHRRGDDSTRRRLRRRRRNHLEAHLHRVGVMASRMANDTSNKKSGTAAARRNGGAAVRGGRVRGSGGHARERRIAKPQSSILLARPDLERSLQTELIAQRVTAEVMDAGSTRIVPRNTIIQYTKRYAAPRVRCHPATADRVVVCCVGCERERGVLRHSLRNRKAAERSAAPSGDGDDDGDDHDEDDGAADDGGADGDEVDNE